MSLSKKVRFEIFKRDGFKCQYCGRTPPNVVLEVDHINCKSKGGTDDFNNLLTACFDCNRGKTDRPLDRIPSTLVETTDIIKEKRAQLKEYNKALNQAKKDRQKTKNQLEQIFMNFYPDNRLTSQFINTSLEHFVRVLDLETLEEAMSRACGKFMKTNEPQRAIRYFCGICWNKIKGVSYV